MARLIGTVRQVVGEVFAVAEDGSRRVLLEGDRLFAGEQLQTGASGALAVDLDKGGQLTLGRDSRLSLTPTILGGQAAHVDTTDALTPSLTQPVAAGPQAQPVAAPDATPPDGSALGGGHSAMLLTEVGGSVTPVVGFPTAGLGSVPQFPEGRIEGLADASADTPPAFVPPVIEPAAEPPIVVAPPDEPPVDPRPPVVPPPEPPVEPPVTEPPVVEPPVEPPVDHGVELSGGALTFNEAHLPGGSDSHVERLTQTGTLKVSAADGLQSLIVGGIEVVRAGVVMDYSHSQQTSLGSSFSVTNYNPATGEVSYSYTLTGPVTHAAGEGINSTSEQLQVTAVDHDGDLASSTLDISILDDVPQAADIDITLVTEPVCTNLLLVVDNSQSMNDPSGVDGLSRLDLAKQAISELLDKYRAMGDVQVQIVTFNSQADIPSQVWVDVATAKSLIAGLGAGNGTNYDAALVAAQSAFTTEGSLSGAQNLLYFFSDGNPTLSPEHSDPHNQPDPQQGDGISPDEATAWTAFLDSHGIKSFAIGLGTEISSTYLQPISHNPMTGAVIVTDLGELSAVLSGTVQGATSGSLLAGGSFGADGGFVQSITVDGVTYRYDPTAGFSVDAGVTSGSFDPATHNLTVLTSQGGTLLVNLISGVFSYTPVAGASAGGLNETIDYVLSDNDGDLAGASLLIQLPGDVITPQGPTAIADHIITNVLSSSIEIPAALLLANDVSTNGDPLSATPTLFNTGWAEKGDGLSADHLKTLRFAGEDDKASNQLKNLQRSDFFSSNLTALVVLHGYLGAASAQAANAQDLYSVQLKAGESVSVDLGHASSAIGVAWQMDNGDFQLLDASGTFTATQDNTYRILLINQPDPGQTDTGHAYTLNLSIDYSAVDATPTYESLYSASDAHGNSATAAVSISYQAGCTLLGTTGDDVLLGGSDNDSLHGGDGNDVLSGGAGNNDLYGDNGDDLLFSGPGNDVLDGGAGNNTASYALASSGVTVSTSDSSAQHTGGAGTDTLINIQNLIGSDYDDHLTGDYQANLLDGGAGDDLLLGGLGDDTLTGGTGSDTFQWLAGEHGRDGVTDFSFGEDTLDLSQLLHGLGDSLDNLLHFTVSGSGAGLVSSIEVGATGGGDSQTIDLSGVDIAAQYGVSVGAGGLVSGADSATIISAMLGDHSMRADVV